mmetsp:Transcript_33129/g.74822  ORF Transcript_33129/g.74822 Transcript_33129/m.74822 type:complete len:104 (-) Transcript_33129:223-534(-)
MATRLGILALLAFFVCSAAAGTANMCLLSEHGPSTWSTTKKMTCSAAMFAGTEDPSSDQPGFSPIKEPSDAAEPVADMGARVKLKPDRRDDSRHCGAGRGQQQ